MTFAPLVLWSLLQTSQPSPSRGVLEEQLRIADSQCSGHQFQQAEATYRRLLQDFPSSTEVLAAYGRCDLAMGRARDAAFLLNEVVKREPGNSDAKRDFAHALVDLNQFGPAEHMLKELLAAAQNDTDSWYYLGVLMYQNGYFGSADSDFAKSASASSSDPSRRTKTAIYRAVCWVHLGRAGDAEAAMSELAKQTDAQKDPDLLLVFAQLLYETQRPEAALQRIDQALSARPDLMMGYFWRGKVLYRLGRLNEAASAEEQAIQMMPMVPYPRNVLLKIYLAQGRVDDAAKQADWLRVNEDRQNVTPR